MQMSRLLVSLAASLLPFSPVYSGSPALAATPGFTITASNVTMSSNASDGYGSSNFTLNAVNGYSGTVQVRCEPPIPPAGVKIPYCGGGAVTPPITLTANETTTGKMNFNNSAVPEPVARIPSSTGHGMVPAMALAGSLLFGFGIHRRRARWFTLTLLAVGALGGLAATSGCGAGNTTFVTPGTYGYTMTATDISSAVSVSTTINVTVP